MPNLHVFIQIDKEDDAVTSLTDHFMIAHSNPGKLYEMHGTFITIPVDAPYEENPYPAEKLAQEIAKISGLYDRGSILHTNKLLDIKENVEGIEIEKGDSYRYYMI